VIDGWNKAHQTPGEEKAPELPDDAFERMMEGGL